MGRTNRWEHKTWLVVGVYTSVLSQSLLTSFPGWYILYISVMYFILHVRRLPDHVTESWVSTQASWSHPQPFFTVHFWIAEHVLSLIAMRLRESWSQPRMVDPRKGSSEWKVSVGSVTGTFLKRAGNISEYS